MRNLFGFWYGLCLLAGLALASLARVNDGAVLLLSFEGDAVHLAQIAGRMAAGEVPGRDFLTPLGAMAFLPIIWLVKAGYGLGAAFAYAPVLIGLLVMPLVWWFGRTRLEPWSALAFAGAFFLLLTSLMHGGTAPTVTASMYYNNWCWAIFMLVVLAACTPGRDDGWVVATTVGLGMGFMALVKAPFAVFATPVVVVALLLSGRWRVLAAAVLIALVFVGLIAWPLGGLAYLSGYFDDILYVARNPVRASPGKDIVTMAIAPTQIVALVSWLAAVFFLRQAGASHRSLVLLLLGAAGFAITHQNWQNDPHWVVIFALLVLGDAQKIVRLNRWGWPISRALQVCATALLVLAAPALYAQFQSLLVHSGLDASRFTALLIDDQSLRIETPGEQDLTVKHLAAGNAAPGPIPLLEEELPWCEKVNGLVDDLWLSADAVSRMVGTEGKTALYADWVNALWLWSDLEPLPGGMPWYYGGHAGFAAADYLVVPVCPMGRAIRDMVLEQVVAADLQFREVGRDARLIVLERVK